MAAVVDLWCSYMDGYLALGEGPVNGVSLTTKPADVFLYSGGKTNIDAKGSLWLQSSDAGGIVCSSGVSIGSPAGVLASAGGNVDIYAGAAMSPTVGDADGPKGAPAPPTPPCASTEASVNRMNALNGAIKGAADVYGGVRGATSQGASAWDRATSTWDAAKGAWDIAKAGDDAGAYQLGNDLKDGIDGAIGVVDQAVSMGSGNIPNVVGGLQSGAKLLGAVSGDQGTEGEGGGTGGEGGGHGGGGMIEARAPAGIKKITDKNMEAFVSGKIEYKAGTNIGLNATNKVETVSMMFEAHANVQAAMKGLARAKMESLGLAEVNGKATFKVETAGTGEIKAGGMLEIEAGGLMKIHAKGALEAKSDASMTLEAPTVTVDSPSTKITGDVVIEKTLEIAQLVTAKANVSIEGQLDVEGAVVCNSTVACKDLCSFG